MALNILGMNTKRASLIFLRKQKRLGAIWSVYANKLMNWRAQMRRQKGDSPTMSMTNTNMSMMMARIWPTITSGAQQVLEAGYTADCPIEIRDCMFCRVAPEVAIILLGSVNVTLYFTSLRETPVFKYSLMVPSGNTTAVKPTPLFTMFAISASSLLFSCPS